MSGRFSRGSRTIWVMALVAAVSLATGLGLSRLIESPGEAAAAAKPPAAGPITVPIESRVVANDVTIRGDARYDDPAQVRVETGDLGGPAVVTGHVPEVGATLDAASVALEVSGRPVILLPGELPTYRTLSAGVSGPDVQQLKSALAALGIDAGDPASDAYDARAAAGVIALYRRVGYEPPVPSSALKEAVESARAQLTGAQDALGSAQRALSQAKAGPLPSTLIELDTAVTVAKERSDEATEMCNKVIDPAVQETRACAQSDFDGRNGELAKAQAMRSEASAGADTSAEKAQVDAAARQVQDAKTALSAAQTQTLTPLPSSEIAFLPSLPRRVDDVGVKRGGTISGAVMSVSGATLEIVASAASSDAELLAVGAVGSITLDGAEVAVTVSAIERGTGGAGAGDGSPAPDGSTGKSPDASGTGSPAPGESGRYTVTLMPAALTDVQLTALQGSNVRIKIPVSSTGGEVLAVPLAALTAGPGGESRVELARADGTTDLVTVETGLAAGGYVEIKTSSTKVAAGDLVVVGARGAQGAGGGSPSPSPEATSGKGAAG